MTAKTQLSGSLLIAAGEAYPARPLPGRTSYMAKIAHQAYGQFTPAVRAAIRSGQFGSELVGAAFRELEATQPAVVHLSRSARAAAFAELFSLQSKHGGVL